MISIIISIISCCVAVASMLFTVVKYISFDKKIANFDNIIKENQVQHLKEEQEKAKRAYIGANGYYHKNNLTKVKFYNKGKAIARNITFETIDDITLHVYDLDTILPFPLLNPQESFEVQMSCWSNDTMCKIRITWEDECGEQEHIQVLQLC